MLFGPRAQRPSTRSRLLPGVASVLALPVLLAATGPPEAAGGPAAADVSAAADGTGDLACPADWVPEAGFRDVAHTSVHHQGIDCIAWWDIAQGTSTFHYTPRGTVRRDQMASFLARLIVASGGTLPRQPDDAFGDDERSVHEAAINRLAAAGIVLGAGDGRYRPHATVTRAQLASYLVRAYDQRTGAALPGGGDRFPDDGQSVHEPAIDAAAAAGFTQGYPDGTYRPHAPVRRGPMASFLARVLDRLVAQAGAVRPGACARRTFAAMSPQQRVGQLFMVGVDSDTGAGPAAVRAIRDHHAGSVLLTGNTDASVAEVQALTDGLQALATEAATDGVGLYVTVDQEGGAVQRLTGPGFSDMPTALAQGNLPPPVLQDRAASWGSHLARAGVTLDLAPVMGTVPPERAESNQPLGRYDRAFGHSPAVVAAHGTAFLRGLTRAGVGTTAKHFPGLGRASGNTDTVAGVVDQITQRHGTYIAPFQAAVHAGAPFVMISLATYSRIDPDHLAVFSPTVIRGMLRGDLGFTGVVLSDSMTAAAVRAIPRGQRAIDFIAAGGDMVLVPDATFIPDMTRSVLIRLQESASFREEVRASARRVLLRKQEAGLLTCP